MQTEEQTNDAPPTTGSSSIIIEGVEYAYTIKMKKKMRELFNYQKKNQINILPSCLEYQPKK